jgi:hypothetical protein
MINTLVYQEFILKLHHPSPTWPLIKLNNMTKGKSLPVERVQQEVQETQLESESRKAGGFHSVEQKLLKRWSRQESSFIDNASALLGSRNPLSKKATPKEHIVWLLDNTAYRHIHAYPHGPQQWQAEFVACYFRAGRKDLDKFVANIAEQIGLHGKGEDHAKTKQRIAERESTNVLSVPG